MSLEFTVKTKNPFLLTDLYGKKPEQNAISQVDNTLNIKFISEKESGKGFGGVEIAIDIIIDVLTGVAIEIIASLIYDKIMEKGKNKLIIKQRKITIYTKDELIQYIETTQSSEE